MKSQLDFDLQAVINTLNEIYGLVIMLDPSIPRTQKMPDMSKILRVKEGVKETLDKLQEITQNVDKVLRSQKENYNM